MVRIMMGKGHKPYGAHSRQLMGWSGWVQGRMDTLWTTAAHRQGSWSSHSAWCGWPRFFFSASSQSYHSSSLWHHPSQSCGSTHWHMDSDEVRRFSMFHRLPVLAESQLEHPLGLLNDGLLAFFTGDLTDHPSPSLLWIACLDSHHGECMPLHLLTESLDIAETHNSQWVFTRRFRGRGARWGECLLYQVFGEAVGLEKTLEVLEFGFSRCGVTDSMALYAYMTAPLWWFSGGGVNGRGCSGPCGWACGRLLCTICFTICQGLGNHGQNRLHLQNDAILEDEKYSPLSCDQTVKVENELQASWNVSVGKVTWTIWRLGL